MRSHSLGGWKTQYDRMRRGFARVQHNRRANFHEYEDDVLHFFMDCWHLKDWIESDPQVHAEVRKAINARFKSEDGAPLRVAADLANGFKHLVLTRKRWAGGPAVTGYEAPWELTTGELTVTFEITLAEGQKKQHLVAAQEAVTAWETILRDLLPPAPGPAGS